MKTLQQIVNSSLQWEPFQIRPDVIFAFGNKSYFTDNNIWQQLQNQYPNAIRVGCSTSGEIANTHVSDDKLILTALELEKSTAKAHHILLQDSEGDSYLAGELLAKKIDKNGLRHVLLFTDGLLVNGSHVADAINQALPAGVKVTGGMAGDGPYFESTLVLDSEGKPQNGCVTAIALYGADLQVAYSSKGGWDSFGLDRVVTRSKNNVLYEIDGEPALDLYKSYLGALSAELPASGLLFPISMREDDKKQPVVRTILAVSEEDKSLTFAGDIPQGSFVRLMKANNDRLITGAEGAAQAVAATLSKPQFNLLVSCIGRKLVLKQIVEEEVEVVSEALGNPTQTGFYSYGELAPFNKESACELHNQTMTITAFSEK